MSGRQGRGVDSVINSSTDNIEGIKKSLNFMSAELAKLVSLYELLIKLIKEEKQLKVVINDKNIKIVELEEEVDDLEQYIDII